MNLFNLKIYAIDIYNTYLAAFLLFKERRAQTLAAAACFYLLLTSIPFFLLLARVIGYFLGDLKETGDQILVMGSSFFPDASNELLITLKKIIDGPLFSESKFNIVNIIILIASSLTFTNVIWSGLFLITGDKAYISRWRYVKGLVIILVTIMIMLLTLITPTIIFMMVDFAKNNTITDFLYNYFDNLRLIIDSLKEITFDIQYLLVTNLLPAVFFILFFTFLYRWFFNWRISSGQALLGTMTFVISLLVGKTFFLVYFIYMRQNLLLKYGDFYTFVVALIWIFQVMVFFFYGACLCHVLKESPLKFGRKLPKMENNDKSTN
jgi:membrane protein